MSGHDSPQLLAPPAKRTRPILFDKARHARAYFTTSVKKFGNVCVCPFNVVLREIK
jgi:hypothetical protein